MNSHERVMRLYRIHKMIQNEGTGTPQDFAERFHLQRRQIQNIITEFKDYGAKIKFSRIRCTYFYLEAFDMRKYYGVPSV
jgi:predicted DNA-binding transcriptional regulator YafY